MPAVILDGYKKPIAVSTRTPPDEETQIRWRRYQIPPGLARYLGLSPPKTKHAVVNLLTHRTRVIGVVAVAGVDKGLLPPRPVRSRCSRRCRRLSRNRARGEDATRARPSTALRALPRTAEAVLRTAGRTLRFCLQYGHEGWPDIQMSRHCSARGCVRMGKAVVVVVVVIGA